MLPSKDPLHGKTLEAIVTELQAYYGWEELSQQINFYEKQIGQGKK